MNDETPPSLAEPRNRLRITIVLGPFHPLPPGPAGAIEKRWQGVALHFARAGHSVTIVARAYPGQQRDEMLDGVRYIRRSGFRRTNGRIRDLAKDFIYSLRLWRDLPDADVTVTNVFWLPPLVARFGRGVGRIVVNIARYPKGQLWLYDRVDALSAVSSAVAEETIKQRHRLKDRVWVVPNPVDVEVFRPPTNRADKAQRTMMYHGRVHPEKGVHLLIEAFAKVLEDRPGLRLVIVGPTQSEHGGGGETYLKRLHRLAVGLPVEFAPAIREPAKLAAALRQADHYCYPSLAEFGESFGVAPLEAMAAGIPPVVSDLACFRDFIEDGVNGLVFDHRADDAVDKLSEAMRRATETSAEVTAMGRAAVARASEFSYASIAEAYLNRFQQLCRNAGDHRAR